MLEKRWESKIIKTKWKVTEMTTRGIMYGSVTSQKARIFELFDHLNLYNKNRECA